MNKVLQAALEIQQFCDSRQWNFCFIGGLAVRRWGQLRVTEDVDLTLLSGWDHEPFIASLAGFLDFRPNSGPKTALRSRVGLFQNESGVGIDVAFGAIPFEERSVARSSLWKTEEGQTLRTCSAEDLVVHKCFANRDHDWFDVASILERQEGKLDRRLIGAELAPLAELKTEDDIMGHWLRVSGKLKRKSARPSRRK